MITLHHHLKYNIYLSEKNEGSIDTEKMARKYLLANQIKDPVCYFHHQHQAHRVIASLKNYKQKAWADAAITNQPVCLAMIVADCFPIILYDPQHNILALAHGGWKPLLQNIIELTVLDMQLQFKANVSRIQAWIGPGIRSCCYHFQKQPIQTRLPSWQPAISQSAKGWSLNLPLFIKNELARLGVTTDNIIDYNQCTACQPHQYFSHYRSKKANEKDGRMMVAAQLI